MYSNKLAVAVKSGGKIVREFDDSVYLPFGSEYSIFIKNKNTVRASVKIEIDGTDVTEGVSLVVDPNESIELERFIKNGNLTSGNRFKFIERTASIEKHRGTSVDDGLIRVEFQFEKLIKYATQPDYYVKSIPRTRRIDPYNPHPWDQPFWNSSTPVGHLGGSSYSLNAVNCGTFADSTPGITAPGSVSSQEFDVVTNFTLDSTKHVIVMKLLGQVQDKYVSKLVTTRQRNSCVMCGFNSRSDAKFCSQCGTSLQIID